MRLLLLCCTLCCGISVQGHDKVTVVEAGPANECVSNTCGAEYTCEVRRCEACIPKKLTCKDLKCAYRCEETPSGPECKPKTCADIRCAAGEKCDELPDGPDCVPDIASCKDFLCRRGTNCAIRDGSPVCLPNTCENRECEPGLYCLDTVNGALCRTSKPPSTCEGKYCPLNTKCEMTPEGPICAHIF